MSGASPEKDEEVFLIGFPVVHRHRLTRPEHVEADSDLREVTLNLEAGRVSPPVAVVPAGLTSVQDEPSLPGGHKSVLGLSERGLGNHRRITNPDAAALLGYSSILSSGRACGS